MEFFKYVDMAELIAQVGGDVNKAYIWSYFVCGAAVFAVIYALQSVALYTIGKREGYAHRWMAFVPFLNLYYMGVVSQKNRVFRLNTKQVGIALAVLDAVLFVLKILYYVAMFLIFNGGYVNAVKEPSLYYSGIELITGYEQTANFPVSLNWAWWIFSKLDYYILSWISLVYVIFNVFLTISFFRTYASGRYILFSLLSIFLPIRGILMFAVRNNRGKGYADYIREQQQRRYAMYQEYMRNNPPPTGGGSYYGNNYGNDYNQGGQSSSQSKPADPFDGLGENGSQNGGGRPDDTFGDV